MSNIIKVGTEDVEIILKEGEAFNEDKNNAVVIEKIKEKKGSRIDKLLHTLFPWSQSKVFNPVILSDEEYRKKAADCLENVLLLLSSLRWHEHKKGTQIEDIVQKMDSDKYGSLFLLTGYVECPAEFLYEEFTHRIEEVTKWNPTILESKLIQRIDHETDITYQLTAGGGGGAIKPRDFINLRRNTRIGDRFVSCGTSVEYPGYQPTKKYIRGENKISCWSIQPVAPIHAGARARCKVQWLMGCDLKGWIPQYVLDMAFSSAMFEFLDTLRVFVEEKHADGTIS